MQSSLLLEDIMQQLFNKQLCRRLLFSLTPLVYSLFIPNNWELVILVGDAIPITKELGWQTCGCSKQSDLLMVDLVRQKNS